MSISPPTAATTATATSDNPTAAAVANSDDSTTTVIHLTYWCHECDMSVLLYPPPPISSRLPPICPHCQNDFLEQMENPTATLHTTTVGNASPDDDDDDLLLDTSYYYRLINSLLTATAPTAARSTHTNPASKSAIESLQRITVDSAFLQKDPTIVCPVCKDQFSIGAEAKMLPCTHTYHADCIVPWLEINNSCPVCRFELPREAKHEVAAGEGGDDGLMGARLDELLQDDQDGLMSILRNVVRRRQQNTDDTEEHIQNVENWNRRVVWDNEVLFSPTQIGEDGSGGRRGHVERANSVETVTSWPAWPVDAGASASASGSGSGSGSGDVEIGGGRGSSEGDDVRS